jgi:hypothetical protein
MKVKNLLPRFPADAYQKSPAGHIEFGRNVMCDVQHPAQDLLVTIRDVIQGRDMFFGDDQQMRLGAWIYVGEGDAVFVLVFFFGGNLASDDLAEYAILVHKRYFKKTP